MRFQLDHDWQGNMATPRARVGESAKTQLLLILCAIWIILGLTGHAPWKPLEAPSISIVKGIVQGGSLIAPLAAGESTLTSPPLYYLTAAASAKLLSPLFDMHDGARLINVIWMTIVLLMVGMTGRELWARGVGRHATFIMMGTIGLIMNAHSLNAEVASLASAATGFYALALSKRRPWRASGLLGLAIGAGFLSNGLIPPLILLATALLLPILFKAWRTKSFATTVGTAMIIASPLIAGWLILLYLQEPALFKPWLQANLNGFNQQNHLYFVRILIWYAWPALPLALWGLWRNRHQLALKPKFQLILTFFICSLLLLGFGASSKDISALPLLLPLVALGAGSVEHLKRGAAAALNWFGITLFGLIGFLVWLGWIAMLTGYPAKIKERMQFLSGSNATHFSWIAFAIAFIITMIWIFTCLRAKQSNRSTVTNWAVGMTFGWGLLMTLWLPWINAVKSYQPVFTGMQKVLPAHFDCMSSLNVGQSQRLLLHYYTDINLRPFETTQQLNCNLYLIQDARGVGKMLPSDEWKLIWQGKRIADRKENFRLFQRQQ
ncbi:MAG: glycosyl transferase [Methylotenera sp. RIFCSPLOWO2_02_FULL_45_14]|nr:MAG: glycosyl transferase [Methylotenera sp. RIFCSPLOWO2_02_FULL_45_14]